MSIAESCISLLKINSGEISPAASLTQYTPKRRKTTAGKTPKKKHARRKATPAQVAAPIPPESTLARAHERTPRELSTLDSVENQKGTNNTPIERENIESKPLESINNSTLPLTPKTQKRTKDGKFKRERITPEIFKAITEEVALTGISFKKAAEKHGSNLYAVISLTQSDPVSAQQYASARLKQADALFARIVETAEQCDGSQESFNRSRLLIDALKWTVSKLNPAKYSDKAQLAVTGADGGPVTIAAAVVNPAEVRAVRDMLRQSITTTAEEVPTPAALLDNTPSEVE